MLVRFSILIGFSADLDFVGFSPDWRKDVRWIIYCRVFLVLLLDVSTPIEWDCHFGGCDVRWISVGFSLDVRRMLVGPFGKNCTNAGHIHSKNDSHAGHIHGKNDSDA